MSKHTWFDRRGKRRTAALEMLDTPFERDQAVQGAFGDGDLDYEHEAQYINDHGTPAKGRKKPATEITAGGNS